MVNDNKYANMDDRLNHINIPNFIKKENNDNIIKTIYNIIEKLEDMKRTNYKYYVEDISEKLLTIIFKILKYVDDKESILRSYYDFISSNKYTLDEIYKISLRISYLVSILRFHKKTRRKILEKLLKNMYTDNYYSYQKSIRYLDNAICASKKYKGWKLLKILNNPLNLENIDEYNSCDPQENFSIDLENIYYNYDLTYKNITNDL